jgi:hypothetical protein
MNCKGFPVLVLLIVAACAPPPSEAQIETAMLQVIAARTQSAEAKATAASALPTTDPATPTLRFISSRSATEQAALTAPHFDGVYRVGVEIAPGLWRPFPEREGYCYWARRKYDGIQLGSFYGLSPGDVLVRETDYEIEFDGCGVWVFMGER